MDGNCSPQPQQPELSAAEAFSHSLPLISIFGNFFHGPACNLLVVPREIRSTKAEEGAPNFKEWGGHLCGSE